MSLFVGLPIEGLLSVRLVGNDGLGAAIVQLSAQRGAVIGFVGEQLSGWLGTTDQGLGGWTIMHLTTAQQDGKKAALSIRDCVDAADHAPIIDALLAAHVAWQMRLDPAPLLVTKLKQIA